MWGTICGVLLVYVGYYMWGTMWGTTGICGVYVGYYWYISTSNQPTQVNPISTTDTTYKIGQICTNIPHQKTDPSGPHTEKLIGDIKLGVSGNSVCKGPNDNLGVQVQVSQSLIQLQTSPYKDNVCRWHC